jgi:hypothetical protein
MIERLTDSGDRSAVRRDGRLALGCRTCCCSVELEALWNELGRRVGLAVVCVSGCVVADDGESFNSSATVTRLSSARVRTRPDPRGAIVPR